MRIRVLSDLHLEFHADGGQSFLAGQRGDDWDVMVLAGDITSAQHLWDVAGWVRKVAADRPVIWVPGNHEYYGGSVEKVTRTFEVIRSEHRIEVLEEAALEIGGRRFLGTTLWFAHSGYFETGDALLGDFRMIEGFRPWVAEKARQAAAYLSREVREGDVVVTHHLPHMGSVAERYRGHPLTKYFLHDLTGFVEGCGAALWLHGHTHDSMDYRVGRTRVLCNPAGYLRYEENRAFREDLTVDL